MLKALAVRLLGTSNPDETELVHELLGATPGVMVEVGAHRGDETLVRFAEDGWEIHAFEPDAENRSYLAKKAVAWPNLTVRPEAVSDRVGTMTLYTSAESTGISSLMAFTAEHTAATEVPVTTIEEYVADEALARVDFLKLDVEGYEKHVLAGFPWESHRPRAILLEFEDLKTQQLGYSWRDLAETLRGQGYDVLVSEWYPIVRYGTTHSWRRFAKYPTELEDADAWGNLIAVEPAEFAALQRIVAAREKKLRRRAAVDALRERMRATGSRRKAATA